MDHHDNDTTGGCGPGPLHQQEQTEEEELHRRQSLLRDLLSVVSRYSGPMLLNAVVAVGGRSGDASSSHGVPRSSRVDEGESSTEADRSSLDASDTEVGSAVLSPHISTGTSSSSSSSSREAATELCGALRTFVLGWDEQGAASVSGHNHNDLNDNSGGGGGEQYQYHDELSSFQTLVQRALSILQMILGPTDGQLRCLLLELLPKIKSNDMRQMLLEFLVHAVPPLVVPISSGGGGGGMEYVYEIGISSGNTGADTDGQHYYTRGDQIDGREQSSSAEASSIQVTTADPATEIMSALHTLLQSDPISLLPVVRSLSLLLPSLSDQYAAEVGRICETNLKVVEADELPVLVECLLRSVRRFGNAADFTIGESDDGDDDEVGAKIQNEGADAGQDIGAIKAIRAIRDEWILIDSERNTGLAAPADDDDDDDMETYDANTDAAAASLLVAEAHLNFLTTNAASLSEDFLATNSASSSNATDALDCVRKGYLHVLRVLTDEFVSRAEQDFEATGERGMNLKSQSSPVFTPLDICTLLALHSRPDTRNEIERLVEDMIRVGIFPFDAFHGLLNLAFSGAAATPVEHDESTTRLAKALSSCLPNLCYYLLLGPLRCRRSFTDKPGFADGLMRKVEELSLRTFSYLADTDERDNMITALLNLSFLGSTVRKDGVSPATCTGGRVLQNRRLPSKREAGVSDYLIVQGTHQVSVSSLRIFLGVLHSKGHRDEVLRHRHIFIGRLLDASSSLSTANAAQIDLLSQVIAALFLGTDDSLSRGRREVMALVEKLLFATHGKMERYESLLQQSIGGNDQHVSQRIGLCLCHSLVRNPAVSSEDRDGIWSSVVRTMLAQSSMPTGSTSCMPEIGLAGLFALMHGCGIAPVDATDRNLVAPRPVPEVYGTIKTIVARTGMVQLDTKVARIIEKSKSQYECFYERVPSHFTSSDGRSPSKSRRMAFSIAPYVDSLFRTYSGGTTVSPSASIDSTSIPNASATAKWCSTLFDAYLRLGRETSGGRWSADGWLTAGLILHRLPVDIDARANYASAECAPRALATIRHVHGCIAAIGMCTAVLKNAYGQYSTVVALDDSEAMKKAGKLLRLIQYQLSLVYELRQRCSTMLTMIGQSDSRRRRTKKGRSKAKNEKGSSSKADRKRTLGAQNGTRKKRRKKGRGGDRLIGHYDTSRRVRFLESLDRANSDDDANDTESNALHSEGGEEVLLSKAKEEGADLSANTSVDYWLSSQPRSIQSLLSAQLCDKDFIPQALLCDCLFSERDSNTLGEFVNSILNGEGEMAMGDSAVPEDLERSAVQIICLRRSILHHIQNLVEERCASLPADRLLSMLETIKQLSATMKALRKNHPGRESQLNHLPSLCPERQSEEHTYVTASHMRSLLSAYYDFLAAAIESNRYALTGDADPHAESKANKSSDKSLLHTVPLCQQLKALLLGCEDSILACQIIDLVSIVVFKSGHESIKGSELSWTALHTVYRGSSEAASSFGSVNSLLMHRPPVFARVIDKFTRASTTRGDVTSALGALDKYALNSTLQFRENCVLRYSLLSHWGLASLSGSSPCVDLRKLVESLRVYLEDISQDLEDAPRTTCRKKKEKKESKTKQSRDFRPDCLHTDIDIPGLTAKSFPIFFEGLLQMIVASFALAKPGSPPAYQTSDSDNSAASPYRQIQDLSRLFREMAEVFATRFKLFPRRTLTAVVRACTMVVKTCERQVIDCVTWRNAQPLLKHSDKERGMVDHASSKFLQRLVDNMAYNCAGSAILLCDLIKNQAKQSRPDSKDEGDDDESYTGVVGIDGENWAYASSHKAVSTLLYQGEKLVDTLKTICISYNLSLPRIRITDTEKAEGSKRAPPEENQTRTASSKASSRINELPVASLRRKNGFQDSTTSKKNKRRVTPEPIEVQTESSEAAITTTESSSHNADVSLKQVEKEKENKGSLAGASAKDDYDVEMGRGEGESESDASDSEDSLKSADSFGADGAWGDNDDDDARSVGSEEVSLTLFVSST